MPYLIRPREDMGLNFMRDGIGHKAPCKWICGEYFTYFENLPQGLNPDGDGYFMIRRVANEKQAEAIAKELDFPIKTMIREKQKNPLTAAKIQELKTPVKPSDVFEAKSDDPEKAWSEVESNVGIPRVGTPSKALIGAKGDEEKVADPELTEQIESAPWSEQAKDAEPEPEPEKEKKPANPRAKKKVSKKKA